MIRTVEPPDWGEPPMVLDIAGKVVQSATYWKNRSGYQEFKLVFTDGVSVTITEIGQTGEYDLDVEGENCHEQ